MKKTILILGGEGFIGRNLIDELKDNCNIISFDLEKNAKSDDKITFYKGNFTFQQDLEIIFKENKIDIVIHALSTTIPSNSNANIIYDINSNLVATIELLDLMRKYSTPKIIFISSGGTVYGLLDHEQSVVTENQATNPICSYGIVKLSIEKYIYLYNYLYGINYLVLRFANPYGRYHKSDKQGLINVILNKIINHETVTIWGDGSTVRDYVYINDCSSIVRNLIEKNISNETINIGSGVGYSINDILKIIEKQIGNFKTNRLETRDFDVPSFILDNSKLQSIINHTFTNIEEGVNNTYNWLKNNE
ncbi:MAG: NAD-dependent epimerase/dehydratase family protein [Patescibacteria group bacterium]|jgi:UDP-glucose 4-epimerase